MQPNELAAQEGRRHRRQFSPQFKTDIVAQCQGRGVSVAAVARQYDLHPNLLRKWVQAHERLDSLEAACAVRCDVAAQFIPVQMVQPRISEAPAKRVEDICIELQHNGLTATVRWPVSQATQCAAWLRDLMR